MSTTTVIDFKPANEATYKGEVTDKQIHAWKQANPKGIFRIISDDDKHVGYFRNPLRGDVNAALAKIDSKRPLVSMEEFGKLLWLGGSDAILNDDEIWLGVTEHLREKMNGKKAQLENL